MQLAYTAPRPLYVKWNRLFNSVAVIGAVFLGRIELLYFFAGLNFVTLFMTINNGPMRWVLRPFEKRVPGWLDVPPAYARSYAMRAETERFEIFSRILVVMIAIAFYPCCPTAAWLIAVGMGVFMLISTFFGFCLSALGFLALKYLKEHCCVR